MAFYLRRGINFGPLRINFSKSGLGFSAGVTGARVGINSQGRTYVHGGRHGLYYRKHLPSGQQASQSTGTAFDRAYTDFFTDTGLTYREETIAPLRMELPRIKKNIPTWSLVVSMLSLITALVSPEWTLRIVMATIAVVFGVYYWKKRTASKSLVRVFDLLSDLPADADFKSAWKTHTSALTKPLRTGLAEPVLFVWLENQLSLSQSLALHYFIDFMPVKKERAAAFGLFWYRHVLSEVLADHLLTQEEEDSLKTIEEAWEIDSDTIASEHDLIQKFRVLREILLSPLEEDTTLSRPMKRGETGYYETPGRLLRQVVLNRWQRDNIPHRELGYREEMSGMIRITSSVVEIDPGNRSRTYPISGITDICVSPEEGVVEIALENRQSPVIITCVNLMIFAAMLEKVVEARDAEI